MGRRCEESAEPRGADGGQGLQQPAVVQDSLGSPALQGARNPVHYGLDRHQPQTARREHRHHIQAARDPIPSDDGRDKIEVLRAAA